MHVPAAFRAARSRRWRSRFSARRVSRSCGDVTTILRCRAEPVQTALLSCTRSRRSLRAERVPKRGRPARLGITERGWFWARIRIQRAKKTEPLVDNLDPKANARETAEVAAHRAPDSTASAQKIARECDEGIARLRHRRERALSRAGLCRVCRTRPAVEGTRCCGLCSRSARATAAVLRAAWRRE